jgi:PHO85 cyclin-6/7
VPKANGHTHVPLSPLSRENSQTQAISVITNALARQNEPSTLSQSPSPSTPSQVLSYSLRGPVSRSAARAILELDAIPPADLLKTLATLLEQIAAANDALRAERTARGEEPWEDQLGAPAGQEADFFPDSPMPMPPEGPSSTSSSPSSTRSRSQLRTSSDPSGPANAPIWNQLTNASRIALTSRTATLSFHARHIPQISLEAYLLRILKYCPTANATFVAVLVYFDRMCRMAGNVENERHAVFQALSNANGSSSKDENPAASSEKQDSGNFKRRPPFAIDSYNVHRLVIAGVTVASKFFSDIFYTNSRYAKVCNPFSFHSSPTNR